MSYRVEICTNNRAGCQNPECKKENVKILKGEIRQGVMVVFQEHQSMKWRHWGCVTPTVLHNWKEACEMDEDRIDGFEALPDDAKEIVKTALENEHVDDDTWNGDMECNRFDPNNKNQGMRVKVKKSKKKSKDTDDDDEVESPTKKPAAKKRGRAAKVEDDNSEDEKPAPKKARGRAKKAVKDEELDDEPEEAPAPKKGRKRTKAAAAAAAAAAQDEEAEDAPVAKKGRGRKAKPEPPADEDEVEDVSDVEEKPAPKRGRGKKAVPASSDTIGGDEDLVEASKPKTRGRKAKAAS